MGKSKGFWETSGLLSVWNVLFYLVAVASAVLGVFGANAMTF